jgi:triosephosphate isomerase
MNGRRAEGLALAAEIASRVRATTALPAEVAICPPATLLHLVAAAIADSGLALGAQDCHAAPAGAHTGDISAEMIADAGGRFVIVGHSERRAGHGESDAVVCAKVKAARRAGLVPILCLGESEAERLGGTALAVVEGQLRGSLPDGLSAADLVVAYEPVWAIGTGRTPTSADVAQVHAYLRRLLGELVAGGEGVGILYGGSVKAANAAALLALADVDGALVGGASLQADEFWGIVMAVPAEKTEPEGPKQALALGHESD